MDEKLETENFGSGFVEYYTGDEYCLRKWWFTTYIYHPMLKKLLLCKFNGVRIRPLEEIGKINEINQDGTIEFDYLSEFTLDGETIKKLADAQVNKDISIELNKFCPNMTKQNGYFFFDVFHKNDTMPSFYGLILLYRKYCNFNRNSINKENYIDLLNGVEENLNNMILTGTLHYSAKNQYYININELGEMIYTYINAILRKENAPSKIDISKIKKSQERISKIKDIGLKNYISIIFNDFIDFVIETKGALICQHCGNLMTYAQTKKYCSLNRDGVDCGKKARNARSYDQKRNKK